MWSKLNAVAVVDIWTSRSTILVNYVKIVLSFHFAERKLVTSKLSLPAA